MGKNISTLIGNHTVELHNCREVKGHDDSLPFEANLFIDGNYVGDVHNDGWGGVANVIVLEHADLAEEVNAFLKGKKEHFVLYGKEYAISVTLNDLCDSLAYYAIDENKRVVKTDLRDE